MAFLLMGVDIVASGVRGEALVTQVTGGLIAAGTYATLHYMSKGAWMGLGDAKLAFPLGLLVGTPAVFSMIVASFWIGAVVGVTLILYRLVYQKVRLYARGKHRLPISPTSLTMKSEIPFAPFLIIAFLVVYLFDWSALSLTDSALRVMGL